MLRTGGVDNELSLDFLLDSSDYVLADDGTIRINYASVDRISLVQSVGP
jgi:hypothetical protein